MSDSDLERRLHQLTLAVDALAQAVNTIANSVPALANSRGPIDEIRKDLGDVAVALKEARQA